MKLVEKIQNCRWWLTIILALLLHKHNVQVFPCCEKVLCEFVPNLGSTLFILATASVVADNSFWPCTLKKPNHYLLIPYEIIASLIFINLIFLIVWIPLSNTLKRMCEGIGNSYEGIFGCCWLSELTESFEVECPCELVSMILGILVFIWMLDATNTIHELCEIFDKCKKCATCNMEKTCQYSPAQTCPQRQRRRFSGCRDSEEASTNDDNEAEFFSSGSERNNPESCSPEETLTHSQNEVNQSPSSSNHENPPRKCTKTNLNKRSNDETDENVTAYLLFKKGER